MIINFFEDESTGNMNGLIRITRVGKLYKMVKMTRLIRMLKMIKAQGKLFEKMNDIFSISEGIERFFFILVIFIMICHFMACFWIFAAELSLDDVELDEYGNLIDPTNSNNWILNEGFHELPDSLLYSTAIYFTVTTITTVGYGDISGTNATERIICVFLMIMGVIFFSFSTGSLTSMISNYDSANLK